MSGVNGLLLDGCCCVPIGPCENDVDDFELQVTPTLPWQINKADWVERFFIGNTFINVIANEPYGLKTLCEAVVEENFDCCGGPTGTETCCTYTAFPALCCGPGCNPLVGDCAQFDCLCEGCYGGGARTACDGVQGYLEIGTHVQDLNVDGDGLGVACCDCPGGCGVEEFPTTGGCYGTNSANPPCPNVDEGYQMLFTGNATYSGLGLPYMCVTPCDNATISASSAVAFGTWSFSVIGRSGTLYFADGNVTYTRDKEITECNTMMFVFYGQFEGCNSSASRYCAATWARKFSPATNLYAAGAFVVGRYYKIKVVGTTNFVAIGAASNTIGVIFQATGVGAGTGSAYLARNALELATAYIGSYELRCIQTESHYYTDPTPTAIQEGDAGDHTWTGIELASGYAGILGDCECHPADTPTLGCYGLSVNGSCGGALSVDYPTCVNAYTDAISQISNLPQPPAYIVLQFA